MSKPMVSVVIPVRNESRFIARCLGAVLNQTYPAALIEVLIADGMSDDDTVSLIESLGGGDRVRVIPNPARIQAAGLNLAIEQAKGEIIVRVDGHAVIAPDYVEKCVETLAATGAWNVGGAMDPVGFTAMGKAIAAAGKSPFAVPTAFHVSEQGQFTDTVYLGAWHREVFDKVGLFNPEFVINQDYELNYRIRKAGGTIYLSPDIRSEYYGRQTLRALARQYFRYGVGKTKTLALHPASVKPRQLVAPLFVAGLVIGALLGLLHPFFWTLWLIGVGAYLALNVAFSINVARQTAWALLWRLPLVFTTIHLAWGAGFWVGVYRIVVLGDKPSE